MTDQEGVNILIQEEFNSTITDFEEILQKVAGEVASGILSEKLTPPELMNKTERYVDSLKNSTEKSKEFMLILKPEKAYSARRLCEEFTQTLKTFKEILIQDSPDPPANSRMAFEQLRKALTDGSDLLFLMREVRDDPSPFMDSLITLRKAAQTKGPVVSIHAAEDVQPLIKNVLGRIDELRAALIGLEKKVGEMKQAMRSLQEESLEILSGEKSLSTETESRGDVESRSSQRRLTEKMDDD